jgi:hypothetical protein
MKRYVLIASFVLLCAGIAAAEDVAADRATAAAKIAVVAPTTASNQCSIKEEGQVNVSFNATETDATKIKATVDAKMQEITTVVRELTRTEPEVQSSNYSANANNNGGCTGTGPQSYQVYGNINLKVKPATSAPTLMASLSAKGYTVNFNVNSYRQCSTNANEGD